MGNEVPAKKTPVSETNAMSLLGRALTVALGQSPPRNVALYLLALVWVETARGASVVQNNPGNLMAKGFRNGTEYSVWSGDYWRPAWFASETSPLHSVMLSGGAPSAFRAYARPEDGWIDYVKLIVTPKQRNVLLAASRDDLDAFVSALHDTYSPDYRASHVATFRSLIDGFRVKGYFAQYDGITLPSSLGGDEKKKVNKASSALGLLVVVGGAFVAAVALLRKKKT